MCLSIRISGTTANCLGNPFIPLNLPTLKQSLWRFGAGDLEMLKIPASLTIGVSFDNESSNQKKVQARQACTF
jgi:hypothetical protein